MFALYASSSTVFLAEFFCKLDFKGQSHDMDLAFDVRCLVLGPVILKHKKVFLAVNASLRQHLLIFLGSLSHCSREKVLLFFFLQKRAKGNWSPLSKYRGVVVYSINTTGGRRKMFITRVNAVI